MRGVWRCLQVCWPGALALQWLTWREIVLLWGRADADTLLCDACRVSPTSSLCKKTVGLMCGTEAVVCMYLAHVPFVEIDDSNQNMHLPAPREFAHHAVFRLQNSATCARAHVNRLSFRGTVFQR